MTVRRVLLALTALGLAACAKPSDNGGGSGGSNGSGGSATGGSTDTGGTTGGSTGTGGGPPAGLGTGKGFSFPQNKSSGACTLTSVGNAASQTQTAYNSWKSTYVTSSGAPSGALRVIDPQTLMKVGSSGASVTNGTVSEGIGYGMLAAVYMADQSTFDGLFAYANAHLDSKGLMNWCMDSSGNTVGSYSASDGDEDIIWALLMASDQWSSTDYLTPAVAMINVMRNNSLLSDGTLEVGDNAMTADMMHHDYFSPAYYRVFAKAANDGYWTSIVIPRNYTHLMNVTGSDGLVPDSSNFQDMIASNSSTCMSCSPNYGYDACRTPWRIAMDYCFNGNMMALAYLQKVGPFFNGVGAANIGDGYNSTGTQTSGNHNMAFIGPAGVAGMAGWPSLTDGAFNFGVSNPGNGNDAYFPQSLRVVTMLMMSGNFLDYSQM
jgi:endo-1,4-beta-D-glucanase Y